MLTPNIVTEGSGFYVSYNQVDAAIYGCDTTALVVGQMERFYILKGDHRKQYQPLIPSGLAACLAYYQENLKDSHPYSDKLEKEST